MKRTIALMLALIMALTLMATPILAATREDNGDARVHEVLLSVINLLGLDVRYVDGTDHLLLRDFAEALDATVQWNPANQSVTVTAAHGEAVLVVLANVGGFLEEGRVWVPVQFAFELVPYLMVAEPDDPDFIEAEVHTRDDILPNAPVVRTTDHGEMAVDFILAMNDNLYDRVPFSYRELEAAEWIFDQLLGMGFDESDIYMQTFSYEDGTRVVPPHFLSMLTLLELFNVFDEDGRMTLEDGISVVMERELAMAADMADEMGIYVEELLEMTAMQLGIQPEMIMYAIEEIVASQVEFMADYGFFDQEMAFRLYSQNVILTIPGQSERKIVVTAHLDSIMVPGASDNASGVALLLESAYHMRDADNYYTIVYAFVGAEEIGLVGVYYYVASLTPTQSNNIVLNINADVLFEGPYFFFGTAASDGGEWIFCAVTEMVEEIAAELNEVYGTVLISAPDLAAMPSDQLAFLDAGHRVVALVGLARVGAADYEAFPNRPMYANFTGSILHTQYDCVHFINQTWPNKIGDAMWTFSLFLERLLMADFG